MFRTPPKRPLSAHSSDTEQFETPRKRQRRDISSPCPSDNTPSSCHRKKVTSQKAFEDSQDLDLSSILHRCATEIDHSTVEDFKELAQGKPILQCVESLLHTAKVNVKKGVSGEVRIMETELYLRWLKELDFVVDGIRNLLNAKIPGTRRRVTGLGRVAFVVLYRVIDGFISDVDHHHDGWSSRGSEDHPIYPITMTLVEEAKDPSTDTFAETAVRSVEAALRRYDTVMESAARRLKVECGRSTKTARMIAQKERALARACCLLCEQTGFGGEKSATGDSLLQATRSFMRQWKGEYGITDDDEYDTQDDF